MHGTYNWKSYFTESFGISNVLIYHIQANLKDTFQDISEKKNQGPTPLDSIGNMAKMTSIIVFFPTRKKINSNF